MIEPLEGIVYLEMDKGTEGVLDTSSRSSAIECATVISVGSGVNDIHSGQKVFVKSWAVDTIDYEGEKYHFVNIKTNGILAVIKG